MKRKMSRKVCCNRFVATDTYVLFVICNLKPNKACCNWFSAREEHVLCTLWLIFHKIQSLIQQGHLSYFVSSDGSSQISTNWIQTLWPLLVNPYSLQTIKTDSRCIVCSAYNTRLRNMVTCARQSMLFKPKCCICYHQLCWRTLCGFNRRFSSDASRGRGYPRNLCPN